MIEQFSKLLAKERADDCRRSLVTTKTMSICSTHDRSLKQSVVLINTHQSLNYEGNKSQVLFRSFAWSVEQHTTISRQTPVVMLTTTIDSIEWLFVKQNTETMIASHTLHERHEQHVMVDSQITLLEDRSQLKLIWCHLIMTSFARNSKFKSLNLQILHKGLNTIRYSTKIVVVHLLVFSTLMSHKGSASKHQVRTS